MENEIESGSINKNSPNELSALGARRRRLARTGLGATGVVLTLSSKGALATVCASPSGFVSATLNTSKAPQYSCSMNGSHGYWKNHQEAWSATGVKPSDYFGAHFQTGVRYAHLREIPLIGVLDPQGYFRVRGGRGKSGKVPPDFDPNNVAMQTVAAYLNARLSQSAGDARAVLSPEEVKKIWADFVFDGSYLPQPGASRWNGAQIAQYFETTFQRG